MPLQGSGGNSSGTLPSNTAASRAHLLPRRVWVEFPLQKNTLVVHWIPAAFSMNNYPLGFNVYRSTDPDATAGSTGSTKLNATPIAITFYRDSTVDLSLRQVYWYTVTEAISGGGERAIDAPAVMQIDIGHGPGARILSMPRILREIKRHKDIILRRDGERVAILLRKRAGTLCECYGCEYEDTVKPDCPDCFGTAFEGGYEVLSDIFLRFLALSEVVGRVPQGFQLKSNPRGWLIDHPILTNGDVAVRRDGYRYEINKVDPKSTQGVLTEQDFDMVALETSHPVYLVSVAV